MPVSPAAAVTVSVREQVLARIAVGLARILASRSPKEISAALEKISAGTRPARYVEAKRARDTVLTVSTRCCGRNACLPRSLATALLCRAHGHWPTWCAGVLAAPPFTAHAWVEAEGRMVGEFLDDTTYTKLCEVAPESDRTSPRVLE